MFNTIRKKVFFIVDKVKGSPIKKNLDMLYKYDLLNYNDEWLMKDQKKNINRLISIAVNNTEYYKKYNDLKFEEFPVINKNIIKSNQKIIMNKNYDKNSLFQMSTSGSTGTPFICYQNIEKKRKVSAEIIFYSQKAGYDIGNNLVYLRSLSNRSNKPFYKQLLQNQYTLDCNDLSDQKIYFLLNYIHKYSQKGKMMLLGYGSTYKVFKEYLSKNNDNQIIKLAGVVSGSDMLFDDVRETIENKFGCRCYSRYSNEENGVLAQDDTENNVFIINEANYFIEIFKLDKDELADEGECGRIVVTDLYNYAMPMIRYDTGDIGRISYRIDSNGKKKRVIDNFGGRKVDIIYTVSGDIVSPHSITNLMWDYPEIRQFQFVQYDKGSYRLVLNIGKSIIDEKLILEALKAIVGELAQINIEYVDEIPVLHSGKRRYIANEWRK